MNITDPRIEACGTPYLMNADPETPLDTWASCAKSGWTIFVLQKHLGSGATDHKNR